MRVSYYATNADRRQAAYSRPEAKIMSTHTDTMEAAAADAVTAPLDLLLTDAALGALRRVNPGGSGLRWQRPWRRGRG